MRSGKSALVGSISHEVETYGPRLIQLGIALLRGYTVPPYNYVRHKAVTPETLGAEQETVERELMRILPQSRWIDFSHQIIHHGRQVCDARKPKCDRCNLEPMCRAKDKTWSS
jgi:hypothetical protein